MSEVLISGKSSFKIEVPYKLIETGKSGRKKPLLVYLHGFGQNIKTFQAKVKKMMSLEAYHLFIQGPYPLYDRSREKKVPDWGRAWYLYDGEQKQFEKSLELSSEFIQELVDRLIVHLEVSRITLFGYSMGGYLAGYFALSRRRHVNDLVVAGGRIKTEWFTGRDFDYKHLSVLALHGSGDESVAPGRQKESCDELAEMGAAVQFRELEAGHELSGDYIGEAVKWLKSIGYKS